MSYERILKLANIFKALAEGHFSFKDIEDPAREQPKNKTFISYEPEDSLQEEKAQQQWPEPNFKDPEPSLIQTNWPAVENEIPENKDFLIGARQLLAGLTHQIGEFSDERFGSILVKLFESKLAEKGAEINGAKIKHPETSFFKTELYLSFDKKFNEFKERLRNILYEINQDFDERAYQRDAYPDQVYTSHVSDRYDEYFSVIREYIPYFKDIIRLVNFNRSILPLIQSVEEKRLVVKIFGESWNEVARDLATFASDLQRLVQNMTVGAKAYREHSRMS